MIRHLNTRRQDIIPLIYGLSLLKEVFPEHRVWEESAMKRATSYIQKDAYEKLLEGNEYGYYYNVSGFENAYAPAVFGYDDVEKWMTKQFVKTFDKENKTLNGSSEDILLTLRSYEIVRVLQYG